MLFSVPMHTANEPWPGTSVLGLITLQPSFSTFLAYSLTELTSMYIVSGSFGISVSSVVVGEDESEDEDDDVEDEDDDDGISISN
jgi:hypothetical protein